MDAPFSNAKVLFVGEMCDFCIGFLSDLSDKGWEMLLSSEWDKAAATLSSLVPDVILFILPPDQPDILQYVSDIKTGHDTRFIPVIVLSQDERLETKIKAFESGASDYVVIPADFQELELRLKSHLRTKREIEHFKRLKDDNTEKLKQAYCSLLVKPEDRPEAMFSVYSSSLSDLGGDFYDVIPLGNNQFLYAVVDICGHDVDAGYMSPAVKAALRHSALPGYSLDEIAESMNRVLFQTIPQEKYVSAFLLLLDRGRMTAEYICAGHPPAICVRKGEPLFFLNGKKSDLMGMFGKGYFSSQEIEVQKGDIIILYTDGLVELKGGAGVWTSSQDELMDVAEKIRESGLAEMPERFYWCMATDTRQIDDDIIIFAVEV